jgi:hypothetical protein
MPKLVSIFITLCVVIFVITDPAGAGAMVHSIISGLMAFVDALKGIGGNPIVEPPAVG